MLEDYNKIKKTSPKVSSAYSQAMRAGKSMHHELYTSNIMLSLDHLNNIKVAKHRYRKKKQNMTIDETVEVMMDMLCRMIFRGRMEMFQEALKQELCIVIKETLSMGPDEDLI